MHGLEKSIYPLVRFAFRLEQVSDALCRSRVTAVYTPHSAARSSEYNASPDTQSEDTLARAVQPRTVLQGHAALTSRHAITYTPMAR